MSLQSFLSRVTHLPLCVPGAGGARERGGWWCLAGAMRPCSALHTSLVSPVCSLPFFSSIPSHSTAIPTSFIATVSWGISSPAGMSNKGKVCVSVCLHHAPERYSSTAECWRPYIWCFYSLVPCISLFLFFIVPSLVQYIFNQRYERHEARGAWNSSHTTRALHLTERVKPSLLYLGFDLLSKMM